jgi:hypothetical protein
VCEGEKIKQENGEGRTEVAESQSRSRYNIRGISSGSCGSCGSSGHSKDRLNRAPAESQFTIPITSGGGMCVAGHRSNVARLFARVQLRKTNFDTQRKIRRRCPPTPYASLYTLTLAQTDRERERDGHIGRAHLFTSLFSGTAIASFALVIFLPPTPRFCGLLLFLVSPIVRSRNPWLPPS